MEADADAAGAQAPPAGQQPPEAESGLSDSGPHRVEGKRHRRERLTRGFGELRAVVPAASRADRESLLSDAVSHIKHLVGRVEELEKGSGSEAPAGVEVEVSLMSPRTAMIRVSSDGSVKHPTTKLMGVLSEMDVAVKHATAATINNTMVQNVFVNLLAPVGDSLKAAIISGMNQR